MSADPHRDACRRQHRIVAHYLAVQAWLRRLDCIVLVRSDLERFIGLQRFKSTRIEWLKEDLEPWFPYQEAYYASSSPSSIHALFLARIEIESHLPSGAMTTEKRISNMAADAPRTAIFSQGLRPSNVPDERQIVAELAVISAGLDAPRIWDGPRT